MVDLYIIITFCYIMYRIAKGNHMIETMMEDKED